MTVEIGRLSVLSCHMWSGRYSRSLVRRGGTARGDRRRDVRSGGVAGEVRAALAVEHFLAYFTLTLVFSIATRRPMAVAAVLLPVALILETLQALTADRAADAATALFAAAGVAFGGASCRPRDGAWGQAASGPKA